MERRQHPRHGENRDVVTSARAVRALEHGKRTHATVAVGVLRRGTIFGLFLLLLLPIVGQTVTGDRWIVVNGGSMSPALEFGDVIAVDDRVSPELGDIITVRHQDSSLVTHRVVDIHDDGSLVLRGDANAIDDPDAAPPDAVVGTVTASIHRPWSTVMRAATSPVGRLSLAGAVLLLLFAPVVLARHRSRVGP